MATAGGPDIERDALVFGYDTGEFSSTNPNYNTFKPAQSNNRFYKGKQSRNYIAGQNAVRKMPLEPRNYTGSGTFSARHPNDIKAYDINGNRLQDYVNSGVGDWSNTDHAHWQYDSKLRKPVVVMNDKTGSWKAKSFGTGLPTPASLGMGHGSKYTISWMQWVDHLSKNAKAGMYCRNTSGGHGFHDGQANSSTSYNTKIRTWERVHQTYTISTNRNVNDSYQSIYMYGHYNVRATLKIADVQIDLEDHPTSYQKHNGGVTERSSIEGLIDLTRNYDIDTSSVSWDSSGFVSFDGTDDKIEVSGLTSVANYTYECVVKIDGSDSSYSGFGSIMNAPSGYGGVGNGWLLRMDPNGSLQLYVKNNSSTHSLPISISGFRASNINKYIHLVYTYNNSINKIYLNGKLIGTGTASSGSAPSNSTLMIGGYTWGIPAHEYFLKGSQPITKLYNKMLDTEDVKRNFNAYKNRFNI